MPNDSTCPLHRILNWMNVDKKNGPTNAPRALYCDDRSLECEHEQRRMRTESHTYLTVIVYRCCVFIEAFYGCALSNARLSLNGKDTKSAHLGILHACGMYGSMSRQCKTFQYNRFDWFRATDLADVGLLPFGFAVSRVTGRGKKSAVLTARKLLLLLSFRQSARLTCKAALSSIVYSRQQASDLRGAHTRWEQRRSRGGSGCGEHGGRWGCKRETRHW